MKCDCIGHTYLLLYYYILPRHSKVYMNIQYQGYHKPTIAKSSTEYINLIEISMKLRCIPQLHGTTLACWTFWSFSRQLAASWFLNSLRASHGLNRLRLSRKVPAQRPKRFMHGMACYPMKSCTKIYLKKGSKHGVSSIQVKWIEMACKL